MDNGWEVHFLIPDVELNQPFASQKIHLISSKFLNFVTAATQKLRSLGVEYVHFLNPEVKAAALSLLNRQVKVVGDWEDWHAVSRDSGLRKYVTRFCDRYMLKKSDIVVTASHWLAEKFQADTGSNAHYIPYAILPKKFPTLPNPFSEPTAVFMGTFHKNWDHDLLIDAVVELGRRGMTPQICMIGKGEDLERCKSIVESNGLTNITFAGFLDWDDMLNRLCWAHVLLFPIRDEIWNRARCPFKVFQYAQAKRPVLTCRVGEIPTFLGDKASYVDSTPQAFADRLELLMSQERLPNIDYGIEKHTWSSRGHDFERALMTKP
ncbi:MAG: glycosyltransferase family 4 protein [Planctomycetota bacterium]